jgi:uncharacterized protein YdeI (YjbR/CyaY-like superfamily)
MEGMSSIPEFTPRNRKEWRNWLAKSHAKELSVWVVMYKKDSGQKTITYEELVLECLCFGWIDSKPNKIDEEKFKLFCAVRKPKSAWSAPNKVRVAQLEKEGLIMSPGQAAIDVAKANGAWNAIDAAQAMIEPADLLVALNNHIGAKKNWDAFPPSAKKGILEWIGNAKTEATRSKRLEETASLAAKNERANQWKPKDQR